MDVTHGSHSSFARHKRDLTGKVEVADTVNISHLHLPLLSMGLRHKSRVTEKSLASHFSPFYHLQM